jgi:isopentenyl diphosphate isomerase/L-lactate dehydrogenase-like FMN-dependent dehydrogenase
LVGRPYVFALASGGEAGIDRLLAIFRAEIDAAMAFSGCPALSDIDSTVVRMREPVLQRDPEGFEELLR